VVVVFLWKNPPLKLLKLVWHLLHSSVVLTWLFGLEAGVTPAKACLLWQLVQLVLTTACPAAAIVADAKLALVFL
jgi:hypothetical protein